MQGLRRLLRDFARTGVAGRSPVESWNLLSGSTPGSGMSVSGLGAYTWQLQFATRGKAYAARVTYVNPLVATPVIDKTTIVGSTTYVQDGDPTGGGSPVNVLFGGSASKTLTAAPSTNENSFDSSDWTVLNPLERTDVPGAPYLWHIRSYCALSGQPYGNTLATLPYLGNVPAGMIRRGSAMSGDKIATPAGFNGSALGGLVLGMALEFRSISRALRLGAIGDSLMNGAEGSGPTQLLTPIGELACHIVNGDTVSAATADTKFWSFMNFGWGGHSYAQIVARLPAILAAFPQLDAMLVPIFSPNSLPSTQSEQDTAIHGFADMLAKLVAARVTPIILLMPPRNSATLAQDNFRKARNDQGRVIAAERGYHVIDLDTPFSNGASPAQWIPALTDDGLHWNGAGKLVAAQKVAATLPIIIN